VTPTVARSFPKPKVQVLASLTPGIHFDLPKPLAAVFRMRRAHRRIDFSIALVFALLESGRFVSLHGERSGSRISRIDGNN
jgi:hypothetical protein